MSANRDYSQNSYNKMGMFTFISSMVVSLGVLVYVAFLSGGIDLKEVPEAKKVEKAPAAAPAATDVAPATPSTPTGTEEKPAVKTPEAKGAANGVPWISTPALVARGRAVFAQNCVSCHGKNGLGDGLASENLSPRPRNLVQGQWKYGGTRLGLMQVLANGSPGTAMQSYSHLALNDRWSLVHYIRSITTNKIVDSDADVALQAVQFN